MAFIMTAFAEAIRGIRVATKPEPPTLLPLDEKIEEETLEDYDAEEYYPVRCGEIFGKRYEVVFKMGYGGYSTVWLARDKRSWSFTPRYVALKVLTTVCSKDSFKLKEQKISQQITTADPSHPGFAFVRKLCDTFEVAGPKGKHICLVHEPMMMDLDALHEMFRGVRKLDGYFVKAIIRSMLLALDYLHSACHIIHTDIKPDNILLGFRGTSLLSTFAKQETLHPSPRKAYPDRTIYGSRTCTSIENIGTIQLADFGMAQSGDEEHDDDIQPENCRAPEVILGAKWSYSVDIWNMANLVWYLLESTTLFSGIDPSDGTYQSQKHLAEIVGYIGLPPKQVLTRGQFGSNTFDKDGNWISPSFDPSPISLEAASTRFHGPEKALFLDFMRSMLTWLPEDRKTAKELYEHEWLHTFLKPEKESESVAQDEGEGIVNEAQEHGVESRQDSDAETVKT